MGGGLEGKIILENSGLNKIIEIAGTTGKNGGKNGGKHGYENGKKMAGKWQEYYNILWVKLILI